MDTKILAALSVSAIGAGTFLIGIAAGLNLSSKNCKKCNFLKQYSQEEPCNDDATEVDLIWEDRNLDEEQDRAYSKLTEIYKSTDDMQTKKTIRDALNTKYGNQVKKEESDHIPEILSTEPLADYIEIISQEAFVQNIEGYSQDTLIWFEDDEVMVDSRDEMIAMPEWQTSLGVYDIVPHFGKLSDDKDVVYIRNNQINYEYEVIREHSSYSKSVLGVGPEDSEYEAAREFFKIDEKREE